MEDCPLCAREVESLEHPQDPWVVDEIQSRFPDWHPDQGVCVTCLKEVENPFRP
jgi:hypothetical protein